MGLCLSKDAAGAAAAATGATGAGGAFGPVDAEAACAWFVTAKPVPEATQRLVCLPWEGGSSLAVNHLAMPFTEVRRHPLTWRGGLSLWRVRPV